MTLFLGIDIGGTAIKAGLLDEGGRVLDRAAAPTPMPPTPEAIVDRVARLRRSLEPARGDGVASAGAGIPGRVDAAGGVVGACANLGNWRDVPLGAMLEGALGCPTTLENDANAAALAEYHEALRSRPGLRHAALLTLGTGVGGGLVLDGRLYRGATNMAGELGHAIVEPGGRACPCGQRGCLERYASAAAVATDAQASMGVDGALDARRVFELDAAGDPRAARVLDDAAACLAVAIVSLTRVLDLELVVLGGGMAEAGEAWLGRVRGAVRAAEWRILPPALSIEAARLGNDAGWIGAAHAAASAWEPVGAAGAASRGGT